MAEWKGTELEEDPESVGWTMLLTTATIVGLEHRGCYIPGHGQTVLEDLHRPTAVTACPGIAMTTTTTTVYDNFYYARPQLPLVHSINIWGYETRCQN